VDLFNKSGRTLLVYRGIQCTSLVQGLEVPAIEDTTVSTRETQSTQGSVICVGGWIGLLSEDHHWILQDTTGYFRTLEVNS